MRLDLSDLNRLAAVYEARAAAMRANPWGSARSAVSEAIREALKRALMQGTKPQSLLSADYAATGQGHYGSSSQGDQSLINPQEFLDPGGVAAVKRKYRMPGPHHSLYGSSAVQWTGTGSRVQLDLTTEATMTPYPNRNPKTAPLATRPIMYYLDHGWIDPDNDQHKMNPRPFRAHVAFEGKSVLQSFAGELLRAAGFTARATR